MRALGFYPVDPEKLEKQVTSFLEQDVKPVQDALGAIVPHAGYPFSGMLAAKTLKAAKTKNHRFIIMGPNHMGHDTLIDNGEWRTPLDKLKLDNDFIKKLNIKQDSTLEHSIEVQLPILQKLYNDFSFVPLVVGPNTFDELKQLAKQLMTSDHFYIASSDFIHFGPNYNYVPSEAGPGQQDQLKWVKNIDRKLAELICNLKAKEFFEEIEKKEYTVCGYRAITLFMLLMEKLGAKQGQTIDYATSYDVYPNHSFVSYVGFVFS
ncbi:MAG: AmmeMemoRadiSam system protein B [Candidatus Aenigmatarchaeota archaeon]